jgi:hypothetical protein
MVVAAGLKKPTVLIFGVAGAISQIAILSMD